MTTKAKVSAALAHTDYIAELDGLSIEPETWAAIIAVESAGLGLNPDTGKCVIRFENHIFYDRWGRSHPEYYNKHFKYSRIRRWQDHAYCRHDSPGTWHLQHVGPTLTDRQNTEYGAQTTAAQMDPSSVDAALESASYGAGQIMGFHWKALGYLNVQELVAAASTMPGQITMLVKMVRASPTLHTAAEHRDWRTFARGYNGSGQVETYAKWLQSSYDLAKSITSAAV